MSDPDARILPLSERGLPYWQGNSLNGFYQEIYGLNGPLRVKLLSNPGAGVAAIRRSRGDPGAGIATIRRSGSNPRAGIAAIRRSGGDGGGSRGQGSDGEGEESDQFAHIGVVFSLDFFVRFGTRLPEFIPGIPEVVLFPRRNILYRN